MQVGDWFAGRAVDGGAMKALRVVGVRKESSGHYIEFHATPPADPDRTEFFGPMTRVLRPVDHDRSMSDAITGGIAFLEGLSAEAAALLKPGRRLIVDYTKDDAHLAALATLTAVEPAGDTVKIFFDSEQDFAGWEAGWTEFRLNVVDVSHGETKGPKTLGSGDAERERQSFKLNVTGISFVPSNAAAAGVAPDIDVTVDGVKVGVPRLWRPDCRRRRGLLGHGQRGRHAAGPLPPPPADRDQQCHRLAPPGRRRPEGLRRAAVELRQADEEAPLRDGSDSTFRDRRRSRSRAGLGDARQRPIAARGQ